MAASLYQYDSARRLTDLTHAQGTPAQILAEQVTPLAFYAWNYDSAGRVDTFNSADGLVDYDYDPLGQLTDADYNYQTDESYAYDDNGNRIGGGYSTDEYNRLESDGTYTYKYDAEGNRTKRIEIATGDFTVYKWDHRNQLVRVEFRDDQSQLESAVDYLYDALGRRIGKEFDDDGDETIDSGVRFIYDGQNIVLAFDATGSLTNRYLHGPGVDQILADEQVASTSAPGEVLWPLTDNLGTVRDLARSTPGADEELGTADDVTVIANHLTYSAFGAVLSETNSAIDHLYAFTGRERDEETGLSYHRARYLATSVSHCLSSWPAAAPPCVRPGRVRPRYTGS